jgi:hypothetical protein
MNFSSEIAVPDRVFRNDHDKVRIQESVYEQ